MFKEDKTINKKNIETFKVYRTCGEFKCCLCKRKVYADDSHSNQGDRLVCEECFHSIGNTRKARQWINREEDKENDKR